MPDLTIRCATPDDWPKVAELGARTFLPPEVDKTRFELALRDWLQLPGDPSFDWENARLGMVNGELVAHVTIVERVLRYGESKLTFGGVAGVMAPSGNVIPRASVRIFIQFAVPINAQAPGPGFAATSNAARSAGVMRPF